LSHSADEGHPDIDDDIDALPVSFKKGSHKRGERNFFLVRDLLLIFCLMFMLQHTGSAAIIFE
jgi:hypothetical protein